MKKKHVKILAKQCNLTDTVQKYFEYEPEKVIENENYMICWDRTLLTHRTLQHNRPDITLVNKGKEEVKLIDIAVVNTSNVQKTINEKHAKYVELVEAVREQWNMTAVRVVPVVMSATEIVPIKTVSGIRELVKEERDQRYVIQEGQKAAILATTSMVRKILAE